MVDDLGLLEPEATPVRGNAPVWVRLEADLPAMALLQGPHGVGKFLGATQIAERITVPENIVRYQNMTVADARSLTEWFSWRSAQPKVAVLEPGKCHASVWPILKSLLEEVPPGHHVWVVSSTNAPAPRAFEGLGFRYSFSLLTPEEMGQALADAGSMVQEEQYLRSLGSVDTALAMNRALNVKAAVSSWIESIEQTHRGLLMNATRNWEQRHTDLLVAEIEKQLGKKTIVGGVQFRKVDREQLLRTLTFLRTHPDPYLGAVTAGLTLMLRK